MHGRAQIRRAEILGQPLNPILTVLPLGILGSTVLIDFGALISGFGIFGTLGHADMAIGVLTGVIALCALLVDLITAPVGTATRQVLGVVSAAVGAMVIAFATIWSVRSDDHGAVGAGLFVLEVLAFAVGVAGAWLARGMTLGRGLPGRRPVRPLRPPIAFRRTVPLSRMSR